MEYRYETHLHSAPVSKCGRATVEQSLAFYKKLGYTGIFITNHFIDANINFDKTAPYEDKINFFFTDSEKAKSLAPEYGIQVFEGMELTTGGTDFLVYGVDKKWWLSHPEIEKMKKSEELQFLRSEGALVIHAHPFRSATYIDHIRLFPACVDGVEVINANRNEFENKLAKQYAENFGLMETAGSDNHSASAQKKLAGIMTDERFETELDYFEALKEHRIEIFEMDNPMAEQ